MDYLSTLSDEQLEEYIKELEEKVDTAFGSSADARDLVNAMKEREKEGVVGDNPKLSTWTSLKTAPLI